MFCFQFDRNTKRSKLYVFIFFSNEKKTLYAVFLKKIHQGHQFIYIKLNIIYFMFTNFPYGIYFISYFFSNQNKINLQIEHIIFKNNIKESAKLAIEHQKRELC